MIKYFLIRNFRGTCSSVEMQKGYMLIFRNAERVHHHLLECWRGTWSKRGWEHLLYHIKGRHWRIRWFDALCDEMRQNTVSVCFFRTSVGSWRKMLERVDQTMPPVRYWKNRIITLLNDSTTASGLPNSYSYVIFYTFEPAKHLHVRKR